MSAQVCAHIDLSALQHNLKLTRAKVGSRAIIAMIKADAYGHGLVRVAKALHEADAFGVAAIEEAMILREAQITQPIIVMSRFYHADQLPLCAQHHLSVVVHQPYQIEILERCPLPESISIWLKLETGMHRLGLLPEEFRDAWQRCQRLPWVQKPIGLMTHLACADDPKHPLNQEQYRLFQQLTADFPGPKSVANSAAILSHPEMSDDWVRPGLMLYGASPFPDKTADDFGLRPVMTLTSYLSAVGKIQRGDSVGYGATWKCPEDMRLGIVAMGYGDGYPRHAGNGTPVWVNGSLCPLVGRVSMDMIALDLRSAPQAKVGDLVILWGKGLPVEQIAASAETIPYELFCHVTQRVEFITDG